MNGVSPNWATGEVDKRVPCQLNAYSASWEWSAYAGYLRILAASLIEEHEKKPIDPLLEEARELVAKYHDQAGRYASAANTREGKWDHTSMVQETHEALRHVLELGKAGAI